MAQTTNLAVALLILLIQLLSAGGAAAARGPPIGTPNCVRSCGGVEVPYPFGIGTDARCYLPGFNLTCDHTSGRLLLDADGTLQVRQIPVVDVVGGGLLFAQHNGDIKINFDAHGDGNGTFSRGLRRDGPYTLLGVKGTENELILTGCNVQATVKSGNFTVASCTSLCHSIGVDVEAPPTADEDERGSVTDPCSGSSTGCCRANIVTAGYYDDDSSSIATSSGYDVQLTWLGSNRSADLERLPVRVFVAGKRWFDDSSVYNDLLQRRRPPSKETMAVPVMLTWEVVGHPRSSTVCKSIHSKRNKGRRRGGYTCSCKPGYHGNPYLTDGCEDDDECKSQEDYGCYGECINTEGSFVCRCSPGTTGNYSIPGGCVNDTGSCVRRCGDVEVPYPFGIGPSKCYWPGFGLLCDTTDGPPQLLLGSGQFRVVNFSLLNTTVRVIWKADLMPDAFFQPNRIPRTVGRFTSFFDQEAPYSLATVNELILTACNTYATLLGRGKNPALISGCASFCSTNDTATASAHMGVVGWPTNGIHGGSGSGGKYCYGMGCCQARISESMDGMPKELRFQWFDRSKANEMYMSLPGNVFIAEEGWFDKPDVAGKLMMEGTTAENLEVPLVLRWELLLSHNGSSSANASSHPDCDLNQEARELCKSKHSHCEPGNRGYSCQCNEGYSGNPYVPDGCKGGRGKPNKSEQAHAATLIFLATLMRQSDIL